MTRRSFRAFGLAVAGALALSAFLQAAEATPVADAAMRGDLDAVRTLLRDGADVNQAAGDGTTPLHWAAMRSDRALADVLLYAGANVKATTRLGAYTPLHLAASAGASDVVAALLDAGADPAARTTTGATPLMLASQAGSVEAVTRLLDKGADPNARESMYEQTALMFAAARDQADVITVLLARGADASLASKFADLAALTAPGERDARQQPVAGGTPAGGRAPQAQASRRAEAKAPEAPKKPAEVPGVTRPFRYNELIDAQGGLTALHFAARQGGLASVKALVSGGADPNEVSPGDKATPLLIATANGHFDLAMYLLDHGANPNLASTAGATPLYAAINMQWAPLAAYPQPTAYRQQEHSYLDLMSALLEHGADPNARLTRKIWYSGYNFDQSNVDESGATAFWRAAYGADVAAMKLLVAHGADPNIPTAKPAERRRGGGGDEEGGEDLSGRPPVPVGGPSVTPLQAAAGVGYGQGFAGNSHRYAPSGLLAAVTYLVEEVGADVNAADADGNTALHHAAARGDNAMIEFLVAHGADVTAVNRRGQTTVDMANGPVQRVQPFPETIALLEKLGAKNNHKCVSC
ncbi:MAG: ankyrin repeat domain-containing protein [Vicinamibacterales bacterium]